MAPVCAVVVAGGSGQRFGNPGGKQLVNVAGRPLMSWSIRAFDRSDKVGHIVVVCPAERRAEMRRLAIDPPQDFIDQINELERLCAGYVFGIETIKESPSARETARDRLKAIADTMAAFA